jgi:hypothetical protein
MKKQQAAPPVSKASLIADPAVQDLATRLQTLENERADRVEGEERARLLASRPDITKEIRALLENAPVETVKSFVEKLPKGAIASRAAVVPTTTPPTRGAEQGAEGSRLPPSEKASLDEEMGLKPRASAVRREGNKMVFGVMTPSEARRVRAAKGG